MLRTPMTTTRTRGKAKLPGPSRQHSGILRSPAWPAYRAKTVSNVINGNSGFNEATRKRVAEAIKALSYRPDRAARSVRNSPTTSQKDLARPTIRSRSGSSRHSSGGRLLDYRRTHFHPRPDEVEPIEGLIAMRVADGVSSSPTQRSTHKAGWTGDNCDRAGPTSPSSRARRCPVCHRGSTAVNSARDDGPELMTPVTPKAHSDSERGAAELLELSGARPLQ